MTRSELVQRVMFANPGIRARQAERCVSTLFEEISSALSRGDRVELRGFGVFNIRRREGRNGRNPRTGESVQVPPKSVPFFRVGKVLRERLNS
jgi:integration host factor subunit beta